MNKETEIVAIWLANDEELYIDAMKAVQSVTPFLDLSILVHSVVLESARGLARDMLILASNKVSLSDLYNYLKDDEE